MNDFIYTVAQMGICDYIYKNKKRISNWMNEQEKTAYNLGWAYAKNNTK